MSPTVGHFGARAIRRGWFALVFPALILNYLGQGALIVGDPAASLEPVLPAVPELGADPDGDPLDGRGDHRLPGRDQRRVQRHAPGDPARLPPAPGRPPHVARRRSARSTCRRSTGSSSRRSSRSSSASAPSERLASAYGIAVTGTLAIDTLLFFFVVRALWHQPLWLVIVGAVAFLIVDLTFFAANLTKVLHGGWFPLAIALVVFSVLTTWQRGREIVTAPPDRGGGSAARFVERGARVRSAGRSRARHRRVPQREPGDDAAGAARQRRAQPRAARVRPDRVADDRARAVRRRGTSG